MTDNLWHPMTTPPPMLENLLFGLVAKGWVSAGWIDPKDTQPVLIGGQFAPDCWRLMPVIELAASLTNPSDNATMPRAVFAEVVAALGAAQGALIAWTTTSPGDKIPTGGIESVIKQVKTASGRAIAAAATTVIKPDIAAAIRAELCGIARYDENLHQLASKLGITL